MRSPVPIDVREKLHSGGYSPTMFPAIEGETPETHDDRRRAQFKADLFDHFGIAEHTKAERVFKIAWEREHVRGFGAVINFAEELVGLLEQQDFPEPR
jgi:hypothetical protein